MLIGPGEVSDKGRGLTTLATPFAVDGNSALMMMKWIESVFNHSSLESKMVNDIDSVIWEKLIINAALNPWVICFFFFLSFSLNTFFLSRLPS